MSLLRRDFLKLAGMATVGGMVQGVISCHDTNNLEARIFNDQEFDNIRNAFLLDPQYIHMAGLLVSSHPRLVREAISSVRAEIDQNPADSVHGNYSSSLARVRQAAAGYMGVNANEIAITDSTTMGTALMINGLHIRDDQEIVIADFDYYSTRQSAEFKARQSGATYREFSLYEDIRQVSEEELADRYINEIRENTRLVTGTWVHSATGLKIPVSTISGRITEINTNRLPEDRVIFLVDGVHGLGVENVNISDLGCDFLSAGVHKWLHGPRGTGILWGAPRVHNQVSPTIPTFDRRSGWGGEMTPGGYKPFEHQWSMAQAFKFNRQLGKARVQEHIHSLARQMKEELKKMDQVILYTPLEENLSSGIVCFDVRGTNPNRVVRQLERRNIIASTTPYSPSHARLSPAIFNTTGEVEETLKAVRELG